MKTIKFCRYRKVVKSGQFVKDFSANNSGGMKWSGVRNCKPISLTYETCQQELSLQIIL